MVTDHEMRMEALWLFEENERLRTESECLKASLKAIVQTAEGQIEGHPTSEINILQRIRMLRDIEILVTQDP